MATAQPTASTSTKSIQRSFSLRSRPRTFIARPPVRLPEARAVGDLPAPPRFPGCCPLLSRTSQGGASLRSESAYSLARMPQPGGNRSQGRHGGNHSEQSRSVKQAGSAGRSLSAGLSEVSRHLDSGTVVPLTLPVVWLSEPADRPPVAAGNGSRTPSALRVRRRRHGRRPRSPALRRCRRSRRLRCI